MPYTENIDLILFLLNVGQDIPDSVSCPMPVLTVHENYDNGGFLQAVTNLHFKKEKYGVLIKGGFEGSWRHKPKGNSLYTENDFEFKPDNSERADIFLTYNSHGRPCR